MPPTFGGSSSSLEELVAPDGSVRGVFGKGELKVKISGADFGGEWTLRGVLSGKNALTIMADGKKLPPYLALEPGRWFNPDDFPNGIIPGRKAEKTAQVKEMVFGSNGHL
jgi:hypothetical protein